MRHLTFLNDDDISFIEQKASAFRLSFQDRRQLEIIASDLRRWEEGCLSEFWMDPPNPELKGRDRKKHAMAAINARWEDLKRKPKSYSGFNPDYKPSGSSGKPEAAPENTPIMGRCPVASEKTRCCNLQTLDAVINCGFDCSYCSIRTFYHTDSILFHTDLKQKLKALSAELDPAKKYHIGTGQSSDSLMWGDRNGMLTDILDFARQNPNVLLELKSKSDNIGSLLQHDIPANVITTWTLNTPVIIQNEEHLTAGLDSRISAAAAIAGKGCLIGFHFHPIIVYDGWKEDYNEVFSRLKAEFSPNDITHISFGTLTFIKPVIKELRNRELKSKILQMPMEETAGKLSYPFETKEEIFRFAYDSFAEWHDRVFFYLCMEDIRLWKKVFGYDYGSNEEFEKDMIESYFRKMETRWNRQS